MGDSEYYDDANWVCVNCGAPQAVAPGARYHRCDACGALYRLAWRSGRLDTNGIKSLPPDAVDSRLEPELLQESLRRERLRLHELNNQIRELEMSKGSERFSLLMVLILICSAVYVLFLVTVTGWEALLNPGPAELAVAGVASIAVLLLFVLRMRRAAVVRKGHKLHEEHEAIEASIESSEATLALRGIGEQPRREPPPEPEAPPPSEEPSSDIIGKFASRQRQRERSDRLGLRNPRNEDEEQE